MCGLFCAHYQRLKTFHLLKIIILRSAKMVLLPIKTMCKYAADDGGEMCGLFCAHYQRLNTLQSVEDYFMFSQT